MFNDQMPSCSFWVGVFVIYITAFVDQEHPFVEVWNPMSEVFAAYLVAKAETESGASIIVVAFIIVTAAELEPSIVEAREQSAGLSACLYWKIEV
ncbi:hypothetical protein RYX36_021499 [Vicia faba]